MAVRPGGLSLLCGYVCLGFGVARVCCDFGFQKVFEFE